MYLHCIYTLSGLLSTPYSKILNLLHSFEDRRRSTYKTAAFPQAFSRFRMRWAGLNEGVAFAGWRSADWEAGLRASFGLGVWAFAGLRTRT
jgi:hypothetical protein